MARVGLLLWRARPARGWRTRCTWRQDGKERCEVRASGPRAWGDEPRAPSHAPAFTRRQRPSGTPTDGGPEDRRFAPSKVRRRPHPQTNRTMKPRRWEGALPLRRFAPVNAGPDGPEKRFGPPAREHEFLLTQKRRTVRVARSRPEIASAFPASIRVRRNSRTCATTARSNGRSVRSTRRR